MRARNFAQTVSSPTITNDCMAVYVSRGTTYPNSLKLGAAEPGLHSLDDQIPFELGDGSDDDNHGAPKRAAGVNILAE